MRVYSAPILVCTPETRNVFQKFPHFLYQCNLCGVDHYPPPKLQIRSHNKEKRDEQYKEASGDIIKVEKGMTIVEMAKQIKEKFVKNDINNLVNHVIIKPGEYSETVPDVHVYERVYKRNRHDKKMYLKDGDFKFRGALGVNVDKFEYSQDVALEKFVTRDHNKHCFIILKDNNITGAVALTEPVFTNEVKINIKTGKRIVNSYYGVQSMIMDDFNKMVKNDQVRGNRYGGG